MKLSGTYQINLEKQKVWEALNDPNILKQSIPGCGEFNKDSDTKFTATAKNKIGPFNASFTGNIELKNINPPNSYTIVGSGNSPVGFASGEADVKLEENENGTKLIYEVEANVGGKIAQVGSRLIDMTAKKMADTFFGKFSDLIAPENTKEINNIENISETKISSIFSNKRNVYFIGSVIILVIAYLIYLNF